MALLDTIGDLHELLTLILHDLEKVKKGNKTAAQRVRTRTISMEKVALQFRKESMFTGKTISSTKINVKKKKS